MKICLIGDGTSIHTLRLATYFARRGNQVHVITKNMSTNPVTYGDSIHVHFLSPDFPVNLSVPRLIRIILWAVSAPMWQLQVLRLLRRLRPDIVSCQYVTIYGYLGALSRFHPFVLTPWGSDVFVEPRRNSLYRMMLTYTLKQADRVVYDSQAMKTELLAAGVEPEKLRGLALGVDTELFSPARRNVELIRKWGGGDSPIVFSSRNLRPIYNLEVLIRAAQTVVRHMPNTKLVICGDGEERERLQAIAEELGIGSSFSWEGAIPHDSMPEYLASADVYVSTSKSDSTSLSLQEAMSCQLPSIVTDVPANREWVIDGQNGFVVPQNDVLALANRVVQLLRSKQLRNEFGARGRELIRERAEERQQLAKLEELYSEMASMALNGSLDDRETRRLRDRTML